MTPKSLKERLEPAICPKCDAPVDRRLVDNGGLLEYEYRYRAPKPTPAEPMNRCGYTGGVCSCDVCMDAPAEPMERFTKEEREALEWALSGDDPYNDKMLARLDAMLTEDRAILTPEPGEPK